VLLASTSSSMLLPVVGVLLSGAVDEVLKFVVVDISV
jgi:hypothetical protein